MRNKGEYMKENWRGLKIFMCLFNLFLVVIFLSKRNVFELLVLLIRKE